MQVISKYVKFKYVSVTALTNTTRNPHGLQWALMDAFLGDPISMEGSQLVLQKKHNVQD